MLKQLHSRAGDSDINPKVTFFLFVFVREENYNIVPH